MTREQKELLLKDLCARLPYEVKVKYEDGIFIIDYISAMYEEVKLNTPNNYTIDVLDIKPYLFPLSSMTDEQKEIYNNFFILPRGLLTPQNSIELFAWLDKNHFDYRGLIEKGLAIDATGLNIY